jgi:hypothetical protein
MSFKRLIPLAFLAVVAASGTALADDNPWSGYVDHHNVPKSRTDARQDRDRSNTTESNQGDYLPRGWPRTY